MGQTLGKYFTPGMAVEPPPETFFATDWFLPIMRRIESFVSGYARTFDTAGINSWYRPFQEQVELFKKGKSTAAVSEHCFAAALDFNIPAEFRGAGLVDFMAKVTHLDPAVRIGWLDYQKPNKQFTYFHAGWGFMIPFDVLRKFIDTFFTGPKADGIYQRANQNWKPGVRW